MYIIQKNTLQLVTTCFNDFIIAIAELPVNILSSPSIPFGGVYQVGSSISLTCQPQGGYPPLVYTWNSTCNGLCFVLGETTNFVRKNPLHSIDSGNHTCSVTDNDDHTGSATVKITLSGTEYV